MPVEEIQHHRPGASAGASLSPSCAFSCAVYALPFPKDRNELNSAIHTQGSLLKLCWKQPGKTAELSGSTWQ